MKAFLYYFRPYVKKKKGFDVGKISNINEAASINADSEDVIYQLRNLFNSNL